MFDPTQLDPETRKMIIENMKRTRSNPVAMLKLRTLQKALTLKQWVENNHKQHIAEFRAIFEGFQAQIERLFHDFEKELLNKCGDEQNE